MESPLDVQKEVSLWNPLVVQCGLYSPLMSGSIDGTDSIPHDKAIQRALKSNCKTLIQSLPYLLYCTHVCDRGQAALIVNHVVKVKQSLDRGGTTSVRLRAHFM